MVVLLRCSGAMPRNGSATFVSHVKESAVSRVLYGADMPQYENS